MHRGACLGPWFDVSRSSTGGDNPRRGEGVSTSGAFALGHRERVANVTFREDESGFVEAMLLTISG